MWKSEATASALWADADGIPMAWALRFLGAPVLRAKRIDLERKSRGIFPEAVPNMREQVEEVFRDEVRSIIVRLAAGSLVASGIEDLQTKVRTTIPTAAWSGGAPSKIEEQRVCIGDRGWWYVLVQDREGVPLDVAALVYGEYSEWRQFANNQRRVKVTFDTGELVIFEDGHNFELIGPPSPDVVQIERLRSDLLAQLRASRLECWGNAGPELTQIPAGTWAELNATAIDWDRSVVGALQDVVVRACTIAESSRVLSNQPNRSPDGKPERLGRAPSGYKEEDAPLLREMRALIRNKKAKGPYQAAQMVADKARGQSQIASKVSRLTSKYQVAYPKKTSLSGTM